MNRQLGRGVFRGPLYQQGYGLGGYFRKFFKWIVPLAEKHVLPHVVKGANKIGSQFVESASNIARDSLAGKNIKETSKEHLNNAIENLKSSAEATLRGEGIKRKRLKKLLFKPKKKSKKTKDIFD